MFSIIISGPLPHEFSLAIRVICISEYSESSSLGRHRDFSVLIDQRPFLGLRRYWERASVSVDTGRMNVCLSPRWQLKTQNSWGPSLLSVYLTRHVWVETENIISFQKAIRIHLRSTWPVFSSLFLAENRDRCQCPYFVLLLPLLDRCAIPSKSTALYPTGMNGLNDKTQSEAKSSSVNSNP